MEKLNFKKLVSELFLSREVLIRQLNYSTSIASCVFVCVNIKCMIWKEILFVLKYLKWSIDKQKVQILSVILFNVMQIIRESSVFGKYKCSSI